MVYNYLLDLYKVLEKREQEIAKDMTRPADADDQGLYQQGRLTAISDFTMFLRQKYHAKLPRRLQKPHT